MTHTLSQLNDIVFNQKKKLVTREVSKFLGVHISEAQKLLKTLAEQNKDKDLIVRYVLGGYKDSEGDTVRLQRFIIVDEEDVEKEKAYFSELVSCVIKSIQLKTEDTVEQFCSPYSEQDDLLERLQGVTFIRNDHISYREKFRNQFKSTVTQTSQSNCSSQSSISQPASQSAKSTTAIKPENPLKKGTLGFAKIDKKMFEEQTKKQSGEANKAVKKQPDVKGEIDAQSDAMECDAESDKDDKPVKNVKPQTAGKSLKRSSNSIQSDSEDELEHKKENKKLISSGKNRKRVRVMADSSDEEFDHNTIESESKAKIGNVLTACLKTKVNEEPKQTTIVFEEESYVDAEGYTVTRAIKKEMKLTDATLQSSEKRDSTTTLSPKQETESSAVKSDSPDEPKKEIKKSAKSSLSAANKKGQTSILSFFKPKN